MAFLKRHWLFASAGLVVVLCVALVAFLVWRANQTVESKTVYVLPEPNPERAEILKRATLPKRNIVGGEVLPADPPPAQGIRPVTEKDIIKVTEELFLKQDVLETDALEDSFDVMSLSPEQMLTHLEESYNPQGQVDFLTSDTGEAWVRNTFAPGIPRFDLSSVDECRDLYSDFTSPEYTACVEERYQKILAPHTRELVQAFKQISTFVSKLSPEVRALSQESVAAAIIPADTFSDSGFLPIEFE